MTTTDITPTRRRCIRFSCQHGWRYHLTAEIGDFVSCLGCRTTVRVADVAEQADPRELNEQA